MLAYLETGDHMTRPEEEDATSAALLALEIATAVTVAGLFAKPLRWLLSKLYALWPGDNAEAWRKDATLLQLNLGLLLKPVAEAEAVIIRGALEALTKGYDSAVPLVGETTPTSEGLSFKRILPPELRAAVNTLHPSAVEQVAHGRAVMHQAKTQQDVITALTVASPSSRVEAAARWITNRASNVGIVTAAEQQSGTVLLWKAERSGCVRCMAYAGQRRSEGGYPAGLTFGKPVAKPEPVNMPPLHPNCRCTQIVVSEDMAAETQAAMMREAKRSILRGWSVESESEAVRIDAARRLLAKNPAMPKSVEAYARKAVKEGNFTRGREFPGA